MNSIAAPNPGYMYTWPWHSPKEMLGQWPTGIGRTVLLYSNLLCSGNICTHICSLISQCSFDQSSLRLCLQWKNWQQCLFTRVRTLCEDLQLCNKHIWILFLYRHKETSPAIKAEYESSSNFTECSCQSGMLYIVLHSGYSVTILANVWSLYTLSFYSHWFQETDLPPDPPVRSRSLLKPNVWWNIWCQYLLLKVTNIILQDKAKSLPRTTAMNIQVCNSFS